MLPLQETGVQFLVGELMLQGQKRKNCHMILEFHPWVYTHKSREEHPDEMFAHPCLQQHCSRGQKVKTIERPSVGEQMNEACPPIQWNMTHP